MQRPILVMALLSTASLGSGSQAASVDGDFRVPKRQRQLFLDDHGIDNVENLGRTMHQPEKRGAVLRSPDPTKTIQTRAAPHWDPDSERFNLWVLGIAAPLWQSQDGLHWNPGPKPNMRIRMAVVDPLDADPSRRFKSPLLNDGFATSPDSKTWTRIDSPAIASSDEGNFSFDPQHGLFIHTVKRGGPFGRAVAIATSRDLKTWKDYGVVFHADARDQEIGRLRIRERLANPGLKQTEYNTPEHYSIQIYNMGVFHYEGLYIGLPSIYHHTGKVPTDWPGFDKMNLSPYIMNLVRKHGDYTGFYNIQIAFSRYLENWERLGDRKPFVQTSPVGAGAYDLQTIIGPSAPVVRGDELWFYYTGIKQYAFVTSGIDPAYDDYVPDRGAICLAVLRRDGFVSLGASEQPGRLTTKPFVLQADRLFVNVAVRKKGSLVVEVLNELGEVAARSKPITIGHRRGEAVWERGSAAESRDKSLRLRFALSNAELYSYWVDD